MTDLAPHEAESAIKAVLLRASQDAEFHDLALSDPDKAVKIATGKDVPDGFRLRFVSNRDADLTLVLPAPVKDSEELSDNALEGIAGGGSRTIYEPDGNQIHVNSSL